jgi:REP element-mobilizing transposase RayT
MNAPLAYFLTWHCYGTWFPGHAGGSVDDEHRAYGSLFAPANADQLAKNAARMVHDPIPFDEPRRGTVQTAVIEVCAHRKWQLLALHVRTMHIHAVVTASAQPEKVLTDFKAYATRRLRREGLAGSADRLWSTHGSTRYVWNEKHLAEVISYVVDGQGAPLKPSPFRARSVSEGAEFPPRR